MKLLLFPHSHFCEKARWALDYKNIAYEPVAVFPGLHRRTIRNIAPGSSLPVLVTGDGVIQCSDEIIDYLDRLEPGQSLTPRAPAARAECLELEGRMDAQLGVPVRQILYASLLDHPAFIRRCFTHTMPAWKRAWYPLVARPLRRAIYAAYVKSPAAADAARSAFERTMTELAARLAGSDYLVGNTFTRADLAVAALLSLIALPPEHPFPWAEVPPSAARDFIDAYRDHPVSHWVRGIYRGHRKPPSA
jgi:glutathione S-transferase